MRLKLLYDKIDGYKLVYIQNPDIPDGSPSEMCTTGAESFGY